LQSLLATAAGEQADQAAEQTRLEIHVHGGARIAVVATAHFRDHIGREVDLEFAAR